MIGWQWHQWTKQHTRANHNTAKSVELPLTFAIRSQNVSTVNLSCSNRFCSISKSQSVPLRIDIFGKTSLLIMTAKPRGSLFISYGTCKISYKVNQRMHTHVHMPVLNNYCTLCLKNRIQLLRCEILTFLVPTSPGGPGKEAVKWVSVLCMSTCVSLHPYLRNGGFC